MTIERGHIGHKDAIAITTQVMEMVRESVAMDVDASKPLAIQGIDSLAAMELRQKLQVSATFHPLSVFKPIGQGKSNYLATSPF